MVEQRERRMRAYWFGFEKTGVDAIDDILEAVAIAGKRFHSTEYWGEGILDGESCEQHIQRIANESAETLKALEDPTDAG